MRYVIPLACWASYISIGLLSARRWFGSIRPYREPVKCPHPDYCRTHDHSSSCYERVDTIDSPSIATVFACLGGVFWPVVWPLVLIGPRLKRWFTRSSPDLPEEVAAKIARMEQDLNL